MKWTTFLFSIRIFNFYFTHKDYKRIFRSNIRNYKNLSDKNKMILSFQVDNTTFSDLARSQLISIIKDLFYFKTSLKRIEYTEIELERNSFWKDNYGFIIERILSLNRNFKENIFEINSYFKFNKNVLKIGKKNKFSEKILEEYFSENFPSFTESSKKYSTLSKFYNENAFKISVFNLESNFIDKDINSVLQKHFLDFVKPQNRNPENLIILISYFNYNYNDIIYILKNKITAKLELMYSANFILIQEFKTNIDSCEFEKISREYFIVYLNQISLLLPHFYGNILYFYISGMNFSVTVYGCNIQYTFRIGYTDFCLTNTVKKLFYKKSITCSKFELKFSTYSKDKIQNFYEIIFSKIRDKRNYAKLEGDNCHLKIIKILPNNGNSNNEIDPDNGKGQNIEIHSNNEIELNDQNIPNNENVINNIDDQNDNIVFAFTYKNCNLYPDSIPDNIKTSDKISNYKKIFDLLFFLKFIIKNHEFIIFKEGSENTLSINNKLCFWRKDIFIAFITLSEKLNIIENSFKYNLKDNFVLKKIFYNEYINNFDYNIYTISFCEYKDSNLFKKKSQLQIFDNFIGHYFYQQYIRFIHELRHNDSTNYIVNAPMHDFLITLSSSSNAKYHIFLKQVDNHEGIFDDNINHKILFFELYKKIGKIFFDKFIFDEKEIKKITNNMIKENLQNLRAKLFDYEFLETYASSFFKKTVKEIYECKNTEKIRKGYENSFGPSRLNNVCSNKTLEYLYNGLIDSMRKSIRQRKYKAVILPSIFVKTNDSKKIIDLLKKRPKK